MGFKLAKSETFRVNNITIETTDDKGRVQKDTVSAVYKRPNEDRLDALDGKKNCDVCREMLVTVEGMLDDDNQPVPYEGDNIEALLSIPPATFALAAAFWQGARLGRTKN